MYEDRESRHLNIERKSPQTQFPATSFIFCGRAILVLGSRVARVRSFMGDVKQCGSGKNSIEIRNRTYFSLSSMSLWLVSAEASARLEDGRGRERQKRHIRIDTATNTSITKVHRKGNTSSLVSRCSNFSGLVFHLH